LDVRVYGDSNHINAWWGSHDTPVGFGLYSVVLLILAAMFFAIAAGLSFRLLRVRDDNTAW
jgi:hypothetical protein